MRGLAILTALLVLLAPVAAAQGAGEDDRPSSSSSSSSHSSSSGPDPDGDSEDSADNGTDDAAADCPRPGREPAGLQERVACACREHPDADACDRDDDSTGDEQAGPWRDWCRDEARGDAQRERCRAALEEFRGGDGRHVTFAVDAPNRTLLDYAIDGRVVLAAIHLETGSDNLTVQRMGSTLRLGDQDTELLLHDTPTGLVRFKGHDGAVTIVLPGDANATAADDGSVARVSYPDGLVGYIRAEEAAWLGNATLLASGFFAFLVPPGHADTKSSPEDAADDEKVERAIEGRQVGAEISVSAPSAALGVAATSAAEGPVQVLAYDDVDVEVSVPSAVATPEAPIRIEVRADLAEGRTIVLNLDRSVLESADPDALVLRYFDLYDQPDGSVVETEVVIRMASSLQDILDPSDDAGQPEFWVVEDANGLQALFTVPHWSAHAITIGSIAKAISEPSVMYGLVIGVAGSALAAVAMLWPRRRDDE